MDIPFTPPINFQEWIDTHREELRPPVGNKVIWANKTFIVMVVGGPNFRTDFHINPTEELFYQVEGNMVLRIMETAGIREIPINAGEMFLLPPKIPHSPQRPKETVGFLVEAIRRPSQNDGFCWYCSICHYPLYEEFFHLYDVETQLKNVFQRFYKNIESHRCKKCNHLFNVEN